MSASAIALAATAVSERRASTYLNPSLADVTIPFASDYEAPWMAIGVIGAWLMLRLDLRRPRHGHGGARGG